MNDFENSILEPLGFKMFWGSMPRNPYKFSPSARAKLASSLMKGGLAVALCGNDFDRGGGW